MFMQNGNKHFIELKIERLNKYGIYLKNSMRMGRNLKYTL